MTAAAGGVGTAALTFHRLTSPQPDGSVKVVVEAKAGSMVVGRVRQGRGRLDRLWRWQVLAEGSHDGLEGWCETAWEAKEKVRDWWERVSGRVSGRVSELTTKLSANEHA